MPQPAAEYSSNFNDKPVMSILFLMGLKGPQLIVILLIVLLLFGANRIPTIMRNLGKGLHSFRQGVEDAKEELNKEVRKATDTDDADKKKD